MEDNKKKSQTIHQRYSGKYLWCPLKHSHLKTISGFLYLIVVSLLKRDQNIHIDDHHRKSWLNLFKSSWFSLRNQSKRGDAREEIRPGFETPEVQKRVPLSTQNIKKLIQSLNSHLFIADNKTKTRKNYRTIFTDEM